MRWTRALVVAALLTLAAGAASIAVATSAGHDCAPAARDIATFFFFVWGPVAFAILVVVCYVTRLRVRSPFAIVALGVIVCSALVILLVVRAGAPYHNGFCR